MKNQTDINYSSYQNPQTVAVYDSEADKWAESYVYDRYFRAPGTILDIGCGTGRTSVRLHARGLTVTAVDYSEPMIARAQEKAQPGLTFHVMDARALAFPDHSFSYVFFSFNGLDYMHPKEERMRVLKEVRRVLKPGGVFAFSSHNACFVPNTLYRAWVVARSFLHGRIAPYRLEFHPFGRLVTYYGSPRSQLRDLEQLGFTVREVVSKYGTSLSTITWRDPYPMYVCTI